MYSREKRLKAIELYIKYYQSVAAVIHELGYPDRKTLEKWFGPSERVQMQNWCVFRQHPDTHFGSIRTA